MRSSISKKFSISFPARWVSRTLACLSACCLPAATCCLRRLQQRRPLRWEFWLVVALRLRCGCGSCSQLRYYQVKYNKILLSRAYVDMANRMKNISILATELCRYEASKQAYSSKVADAPYAVKKIKKSVADLMTQQRVLRAARQEDAAAKLGDILQLTIVEAVNLDMLDRFSKVDASCVAVLTDAQGRLAFALPSPQ